MADMAQSSMNGPVTQGAMTLGIETPPRTVTYSFTTSVGDALRYAVVVNGKPLDVFATSTKALVNGVVRVDKVKKGDKVSLLLHSDACPGGDGWRANPVYEVTIADHDIRVNVTEKTGLLSDPDIGSKPDKTDTKTGVETYKGLLSGEIWKRISHKYTPAEAEKILADEPDANVRAAVKSIYEGASMAPDANDHALVSVVVAGWAKNFEVKLLDAANPHAHIPDVDFLGDVLPRAHPAGYAAIIKAGIAAKVPSIDVMSCWRPIKGSIAHRAGLGMDVGQLGALILNREELKSDPNKKRNNVTDREKTLFATYESAEEKQATAQARLTEAAAKLKDAAAALAKAKDDPEATKAHKEAVDAHDAAKKAWTQSTLDTQAAEKAWSKEREDTQDSRVKAFRNALVADKRVRAIFDPWLMDLDTGVPGAVPNTQSNKDQCDHAHHLHATIREPSILPG